MLVSGVLHNDLIFTYVIKLYHGKSSGDLTPNVITVLLTIFMILYIPSPGHIYYLTGGLYFLITFISFIQPL